jgi:hypothetical protein
MSGVLEHLLDSGRRSQGRQAEGSDRERSEGALMKRRGFLKLLGAAPIAAVAPKILAADAPYVARYVHKTVAAGFAITDEVWYDNVAFAPRKSGILTRAAFAEQLRDGLNEIFTREYSRGEVSDEWREMFENRPTGEEWKKQYECMPEMPKHEMRLRSEHCRNCGMSLEEIVERGEDYCYGRER